MRKKVQYIVFGSILSWGISHGGWRKKAWFHSAVRNLLAKNALDL